VSYDAILLFLLAILLGAVALDVLYRKGILWGPDPWIHGDRKPGPDPPQWLHGPHPFPQQQGNGPTVVHPERVGKRPDSQKGQGQKGQAPKPNGNPQKPPPPRPGRRGNAPF
jgi:hypothetical protein